MIEKFQSKIPATVVYLRFALKAAPLFDIGQGPTGVEFVKSGTKRIADAIAFAGKKRRYAEAAVR